MMHIQGCIMREAVELLHREGYIVLSIEQVEGSIALQDLRLEKGKKYAVIFGNEVKGVQQEVVDMSDGCIELPQYGTKHSFNVSVTAGPLRLFFFFFRLSEASDSETEKNPDKENRG